MKYIKEYTDYRDVTGKATSSGYIDQQPIGRGAENILDTIPRGDFHEPSTVIVGFKDEFITDPYFNKKKLSRRKIRRKKSNNTKNELDKMYKSEGFDFEETWIDEPESNNDFTYIGIKFGKSGPEFKIGEKVICTGKYDDNDFIENEIGYVVDYDYNYLIYFINKINGHDGNGRLPKGHGWFVPSILLKKI